MRGSEMCGYSLLSLSICPVCGGVPSGYLTTTQILACQSEDEPKARSQTWLAPRYPLPFSKTEIGEKELRRA